MENKDLFNAAKTAQPVELAGSLSDMTGNTEETNFLFDTPKPIEETPKATEQAKTNDLPPNPQEQSQQTRNTLNGSFINEEFAVMVADNVISFVGSYAFTRIFKVPVNKKEFALDAKEKNQAELIAAEILKQTNIDISNPYVALVIWAISVYVPKVANVMETKSPEIAEYKAKVESGEIIEGETPKKKDGRGRPRKVK
jgi:hypothetical protein